MNDDDDMEIVFDINMDGMTIDGLIGAPFVTQMEDFYDLLESFQNNENSQIFSFDPNEYNYIDTIPVFEKTFSNASISRLVRNNGVAQISKNSIPTVRRIIETELYSLLDTSVVFKDERDAKILQEKDIINALHFKGTHLPNLK